MASGGDKEPESGDDTSPELRFQYFSDLHLEFHAADRRFVDRLPLVASAPYLIIAGDLGCPRASNYQGFLARVAPLYRRVFLVNGNHEYYGGKGDESPGGARDWLRRVDATVRGAARSHPNVTFLQDEAYELPGTDVAVYGTTLWSNVAPVEELTVFLAVSDYRRIPGFRVEDSRALFEESLARLQGYLAENPTKRLVVVTHHLPSLSLVNPRYWGSGVNSAFASEVSVVAHPNVSAWVAGHTHDAVEQGIFHVNPVGYAFEEESCLQKTFTLAPPRRFGPFPPPGSSSFGSFGQ